MCKELFCWNVSGVLASYIAGTEMDVIEANSLVAWNVCTNENKRLHTLAIAIVIHCTAQLYIAIQLYGSKAS